MKNPKIDRLVMQLAGLLLLGLVTHLGFADTGDGYVNSVNPNALTVASNGTAYTQLTNPPLSINIQAYLLYDTGIAGRIKSWWIQPKISNGYGIAYDLPGLEIYRESKSYPIGGRPKTLPYRPIYFNVSTAGQIQTQAVLMCNMLAGHLRDQGKTNAQIFSEDRWVQFKINVEYEVDANGPGSKKQIWEYSPPKMLKVRCSRFKGSSIPTPGKLQDVLRVVKATMQLKEVALPNGVCRIDTTTAIVANRANAVVRYRFVDDKGNKSKVFTTKTKNNRIAVVKHAWDIPNGPGTEQGWIRIVGVAPVFKTDDMPYSMQCHPKPSGSKLKKLGKTDSPSPGVKGLRMK